MKPLPILTAGQVSVEILCRGEWRLDLIIYDVHSLAHQLRRLQTRTDRRIVQGNVIWTSRDLRPAKEIV